MGDGERWTAAGFVAVYLAIKIIDYVLPGGRSFRALDRWTRKNDDKETDGEQP